MKSSAVRFAIVIGAGPAGLAAARELMRRRVKVRVLERGAGSGHAWHQLYDSLRLHTGRHLSSLPGLSFPVGTPLFPTRAQFCDYLESYTRYFGIPVEPGSEVTRAQWRGTFWEVQTSRGFCRGTALVLATGLISNPQAACWPGFDQFRGERIHSVSYRNPQRWSGRRVLVVGVGNSGAEIAAELAEAGVDVSISVRRGAHVVPLVLFGLPIQYWSLLIERFPKAMRESLAQGSTWFNRLRRGPPVLPVPPWSALDKPPVIGFRLSDAISAGKVKLFPEVLEFQKDRALFTDDRAEPFDAVILATGFRASTGYLPAPFETDERGFPISDSVRARDLPNCWLMGHRYAAVGALANIRRRRQESRAVQSHKDLPKYPRDEQRKAEPKYRWIERKHPLHRSISILSI